MYINKADINVKPDDATKVYGDEPSYRLVTGSNLITADELNEVAASAIFTSDGADRKAKAGEYDISVVLQKTSNDNLSFIVSGTGKLNVTKAPSTARIIQCLRLSISDLRMTKHTKCLAENLCLHLLMILTRIHLREYIQTK